MHGVRSVLEMPEDTESLRRDCQVERESQGLDFAEKAHWCAIWNQGRGPGRGNDYWQCHQGISERHGNDIRYGRHLQGGNPGIGFNYGVGESNVDFGFTYFEVDSSND